MSDPHTDILMSLTDTSFQQREASDPTADEQAVAGLTADLRDGEAREAVAISVASRSAIKAINEPLRRDGVDCTTSP